MTKGDLNELWLGLYKAISAVTPPPFPIKWNTIFCYSSLVSLNGKGGAEISLSKIKYGNCLLCWHCAYMIFVIQRLCRELLLPNAWFHTSLAVVTVHVVDFLLL